MSTAKILKESKYYPLITNIINSNQWTVTYSKLESDDLGTTFFGNVFFLLATEGAVEKDKYLDTH